MFDVAWSELLLVAIVAILVVGPKELPGLLRTAGRALGKLRSSADEFRKHFDDAVKEAGAEDLQREMRALRQNNPLTQIRDSIEEAGRGVGNLDKPAKPEAQADDDLGPPPPLPPKPGSSYAASSPAAEENRAAEGVATPPAPPSGGGDAASASSSSKELNGGLGPETRINGEHRPAG